MNKAFAYIVNTTQEDQKIAKNSTAGRTMKKPSPPNCSSFDPVVLTHIGQLQGKLFNYSNGRSKSPHNLRADVSEVLASTAIMHFGEISRLAPHSS